MILTRRWKIISRKALIKLKPKHQVMETKLGLSEWHWSPNLIKTRPEKTSFILIAHYFFTKLHGCRDEKLCSIRFKNIKSVNSARKIMKWCFVLTRNMRFTMINNVMASIAFWEWEKTKKKQKAFYLKGFKHDVMLIHFLKNIVSVEGNAH